MSTPMPEPGDATPKQPAGEPEKTPPAKDEAHFTQADVDRILAGRIGPLKEKADAYDKQVEASKTEAQKQAEAMSALKAENDRMKAAEARRSAGLAAKLPANALAYITGSTDEEIAASVKGLQTLVEELGGAHAPNPDPTQGRVPTKTDSGADWLRASFQRH